MDNIDIPKIVKYKIDPDKWLHQSMKHSQYDNAYIILILSNYLKLWIDSETKIERFIDDDTFFNKFKDFVFKEYVKPLQTYLYDYDEGELYEHYNMTYSDEIVDIFIYFKQYTKSFNSQLFHDNKDTSFPLLQFVYSVCDYESPYNDDGDETLTDEEIPEIVDTENL